MTFQYKGGAPLSFPDIEALPGEPLLILGESGCGKSTLLHLLAGLLRPKSGHVFIADQDLSKMKPSQTDAFRGQHIGLVYQKAYFIQSLSLLDNLMISPFAKNENRAHLLAEELGIKKLLKKLPAHISVGEAQRATIARAVMHGPKVLLADEPTSALDNTNCETVIQLLKSQAKKNNAALIIVTHDERLKKHVDRVLHLNSVVSNLDKV